LTSKAQRFEDKFLLQLWSKHIYESSWQHSVSLKKSKFLKDSAIAVSQSQRLVAGRDPLTGTVEMLINSARVWGGNRVAQAINFAGN